MNNWLYYLLAALIIAIVIWIYGVDRVKEKAEQEKKDLLREKDKLLARQKIKERLRTLLMKKFKWRLNLGYTALLISFAGISILTGILTQAGYGLTGFVQGATITEGALLVASLYAIQKPVEFKHILTQCAPFLKKRIFGKDINIDAKIKETENRIDKIDQRIFTLNHIIAA